MPKKFSDESLRRAMDQLLEMSTPLPEINLASFSRVHDDSDGDDSQVLEVGMLLNGDICINTDGPLRFRHYGGGGASLHTHNALRILMFAMRLDKELDERRKKLHR